MYNKPLHAEEILKQRYANGEIDEETYKRMLRDIGRNNYAYGANLKRNIALLVITISLVFIGYFIFMGVMHGNSSIKNNALNTNALAVKTQNKLPIPTLLEDKNPDPNVADFTLEPREGTTSFLPDTETQTLGYNGSFLGPVLRIKKGEKVNIHVNNKLNEATTIHWHGLVANGDVDGSPHQGIQPGASWNPSFTVNQPAATLWFHPHFIGSTATQVYNGLAGLLYVDDEISENLKIPKDYGVNDIPLIIQDRSFNKDGSFIYDTNMMDGAVGNTILVNGAITPELDVKKIKMRFRIVNGANAGNFNLKFNNETFIQIASDGGFLQKPVNRSNIFITPGERAEIIVDFSKYSKGARINLVSDSKNIMSFNVIGDGVDKTEVPESLTEITKIPESQAINIRKIELDGMGHMVSINGQKFDMNTINDTIKLGTTEIWEITNPKSMMMHAMGHPFHIHGVQFQVLSRDGKSPAPAEQGWKDTVFVGSGEKVRIIVNFKNKGTFMYHCHILEHEEAGMMGQIKIE